jgi:hypothetical protein
VEAARGHEGDHLWEVLAKGDVCLGWSIESKVASLGAFITIQTLQGDQLWDAFRRKVTSLTCERAKWEGEVTTYGTHDGLFSQISHSRSPLPVISGGVSAVEEGRRIGEPW